MSDAENDLFGDETQPRSPQETGDAPETTKSSPKADADPNDLFGDEDNDEGKRSRGTSRSRSTTPPSSPGGEGGTPNPLEYAESEGSEQVEETWANLPLPTWPRMHPTDGKVWHLKLPAYVNIESRPYEPDFYRSTLEGGDEHLRGSAAKGRMIGVRNTMRWRWTTSGVDGEAIPESNARMLRWSDGSVSLQLGSEMFDVAPSYGATLARPQDVKDKEGEGSSKSTAPRAGAETSFVCVGAPNEQVLVTETAIEGQLSLVPTSMDSKTHRELVKHVGAQHVKHSRMKILNDEADPERVAQLLALAGPQRAQQQTKTRSRRAPGTGAGAGAGRSRAGGTRPRRAVKRADSEDSVDAFNDPDRRGGRAGEYDEDDGFVVADSETEPEAELSDEEDDDDGDYARRSSSKKKKSKGKRRHDDGDDLDEMELADAKIEARDRERERKRVKTKKSRAYSDDDDDDDDADAQGEPEVDEAEMDMDVESEEE